MNRVKTRRGNKTSSFENAVMSYFQRVRPQCKVEISTRRVHRKNDTYSVDRFCGHCNTAFGAMGCYYLYCPCQEARPFLTEEEIKRGIKKRELDELRKQYKQAKGHDVIQMYEFDWWNM